MTPGPDPLSPSSAPIPPASAADRWFRVDDLQQGLGRRTARGGIYTGATTAINFLVTTASTVLITRNLTDEDFGLYGMVIVLAGFAAMFVDLGLSRAVIQKPEINHAQVSTLFWINLVLAAGLALIVIMLTPLLVWFYDEPRLAPVNIAMAGLFCVSALAIQHRALLARRMEFGKLNLISLLAAPIAALVAVIVAYRGGGVWALVALPAVSQVIVVMGCWFACPWIPSRPRRNAGTRAMLAFGGHVTGFQFINYFARNADNAMLGYAWGAGPLGLYTRAYSLMMLPATKLNGPLTSVLVPALSRMTNDPVRYRQGYRRSIFMLTTMTSSSLGLFILISPELVPLLLGAQWQPIVPLLMLLSPAALVASNNVAPGWLYLSFGHVDKQLRWAVFTVPVHMAVMAVGLQWGASGMAIAVGLYYPLHWIPYMAYATRTTPVSLRDYLAAAGKPQCVVVFAMLVATIIPLWISTKSDFGFSKAVFNQWLLPDYSTGIACRTMIIKSLIYCVLVSAMFVGVKQLRCELVLGIKLLRK